MKEEEIVRLDPSSKGRIGRFIKEIESGAKHIKEYYNFDTNSLEVD